jgi:hypothetical protein
MNSREINYRLRGIYYGYPPCCVNSFVKRVLKYPKLGKHTKSQEKVIDNKGFIPCNKCSKVVSKDTLHLLIRNRICSKKYPNQGTDKEFEKFISTLQALSH